MVCLYFYPTCGIYEIIIFGCMLSQSFRYTENNSLLKIMIVS